MVPLNSLFIGYKTAKYGCYQNEKKNETLKMKVLLDRQLKQASLLQIATERRRIFKVCTFYIKLC